MGGQFPGIGTALNAGNAGVGMGATQKGQTAVTGANGTLQAYDTASMAGTTAPPPGLPQGFNPMAAGATTEQLAGGNAAATAPTAGLIKGTNTLAKPRPVAPAPAARAPAATPTAPAPAASTGINPINMNWVNNPANLAVADVYNPSQGGSAPGIVQKSGTYNPIQAFIQPNGMMPQFYTNGKGGYFSDAAGTKPLPQNVVDYMKFNGIQ